MKTEANAAKNEWKSRYRRIELCDGTERAFRFIACGMRELSDEKTYISFPQLPLLLLAHGTEQLLKHIICSKSYHQIGVYPSLKSVHGHTILLFSDRVFRECFSPDYQEHGCVRDDLLALGKDEILREFLSLLEWYAGGMKGKSQGRYYNLDAILTNDVPEDPENHGLGSIENTIIAQRSLGYGKNAQIEAGKVIVQVMTKFYRLLAHLIRFGNVGDIQYTSFHTSIVIRDCPSRWYVEMLRENKYPLLPSRT